MELRKVYKKDLSECAVTIGAKVKGLGLITPVITKQPDDPSFHLKIVREMCSYKRVAASFLQDLKKYFVALIAIKLLPFLDELFYQYVVDTVFVNFFCSFTCN